jgi:Protein of unknown function (DUF3606)
VKNGNQVRAWTKKLNVSLTDLEKVVEAVGNSAAEVKKELGRAIRGPKEATWKHREGSGYPPIAWSSKGRKDFKTKRSIGKRLGRTNIITDQAYL